MYNYLVWQAEGRDLTLKRYLLTGPGIPLDGDLIAHNTVPLGMVESVQVMEDNCTFVVTADRKLPYILIGTILSVGKQ